MARTGHFDIWLQHSCDLVKKGIVDLAKKGIVDLVKKGIVDLVYVKSEDNIADALTKGLPRITHERHVKGMGLRY